VAQKKGRELISSCCSEIRQALRGARSNREVRKAFKSFTPSGSLGTSR